jgi:hypothetical protein
MNRTDLKARRQHTLTKLLLPVETSSPLTNRLKRFLESIMAVMKGRAEPTSHLNIARRRGTRIFTEFLPSMKAENQGKTVYLSNACSDLSLQTSNVLTNLKKTNTQNLQRPKGPKLSVLKE